MNIDIDPIAEYRMMYQSRPFDVHDLIASALSPCPKDFAQYRLAWDAAASFQIEPPFPLHVDLELTFRCNLRCEMCVLSLPNTERRRWGDPKLEISFEKAKHIIDEIASESQASLSLNGVNEPLQIPWLPDIVAHARSQGIVDVSFNTNGLLLTRERAQSLVQAGLTRIGISLDAATDGTYQRIRVGSSFERVVSHLHQLLQLRSAMNSQLPIVRLNFILMGINDPELPSFIDTWRHEVESIGILQFFNPFSGQTRIDKERRLQATERPPRTHPQAFRCSQPWQRVVVRNNGDVLPCCAWQGMSLVMGNIHEHTLSEIWNSSTFIAFRRLHLDGRYISVSACRECFESGWEGGKACETELFFGRGRDH